jgi:hypothetical protein
MSESNHTVIGSCNKHRPLEHKMLRGLRKRSNQLVDTVVGVRQEKYHLEVEGDWLQSVQKGFAKTSGLSGGRSRHKLNVSNVDEGT